MSGEQGEQLRLFVACELTDETRQALGGIQTDLRRQGADRVLRWVRPEGIHLTLKFLGSVPQGQVGDIETALHQAIEPFEWRVRLAGLGTFGGARVRVVWAGLEGDIEGLASLARQIDQALEPLGFRREARPFAAHLTLGRVREQASPDERKELAALVRRYGMPEFPSMPISEVSLMQSILGPAGSVYRRLAAFPKAGRRVSA